MCTFFWINDLNKLILKNNHFLSVTKWIREHGDLISAFSMVVVYWLGLQGFDLMSIVYLVFEILVFVFKKIDIYYVMEPDRCSEVVKPIISVMINETSFSYGGEKGIVILLFQRSN